MTQPNLYQRIMAWRWKQQHKHDLGEGWAEENLDELTNRELVEEISQHLDKMLDELKKELKGET